MQFTMGISTPSGPSAPQNEVASFIERAVDGSDSGNAGCIATMSTAVFVLGGLFFLPDLVDGPSVTPSVTAEICNEFSSVLMYNMSTVKYKGEWYKMGDMIFDDESCVVPFNRVSYKNEPLNGRFDVVMNYAPTDDLHVNYGEKAYKAVASLSDVKTVYGENPAVVAQNVYFELSDEFAD